MLSVSTFMVAQTTGGNVTLLIQLSAEVKGTKDVLITKFVCLLRQILSATSTSVSTPIFSNFSLYTVGSTSCATDKRKGRARVDHHRSESVFAGQASGLLCHTRY